MHRFKGPCYVLDQEPSAEKGIFGTHETRKYDDSEDVLETVSSEKCYVCDDIQDFRPGAILPVCKKHLDNPTKTKDAVEEKILEIVVPFVRGGDKLEKKLRELVALVRKHG